MKKRLYIKSLLISAIITFAVFVFSNCNIKDNNNGIIDSNGKEIEPSRTDNIEQVEPTVAESTIVGFLQLDEIKVIGNDNINVINDIDKNIDEILKRKDEPVHKDVFNGSDAYIFSDITYLTVHEEGEEIIRKIIVRSPYEFEEFKVGNSVQLVESMFGKSHSKGYSEEDELWFMVYKTKDYQIIFYTENELGDVIAISFEKDDELSALRRRIADLEEENYILKKASAFFAKNQK